MYEIDIENATGEDFSSRKPRSMILGLNRLFREVDNAKPSENHYKRVCRVNFKETSGKIYAAGALMMIVLEELTQCKKIERKGIS